MKFARAAVVSAAVLLACGAAIAYFAGGPSGKAPQVIERDGMMWIPGGRFLMGSDHKLAQDNERPAHRVKVDGFWMDRYHVTNAEFRRFVEATGYVTTAERKPDWETLKVQAPPGTPRPPESALVPGAMVFVGTDRLVQLDDWSQWWRYVPGADWQHPQGPGSSIEGKDDHPVVQVLTRTRRHTRSGSASACRPRPNGNSPRAAASSRRPTRGATTSRPRARGWRTTGM